MSRMVAFISVGALCLTALALLGQPTIMALGLGFGLFGGLLAVGWEQRV